MRLSGTDTFLIPCGNLLGRTNESAQILYSPLNDNIAMLDAKAADHLQEYHCGKDAGEDIRELYDAFIVKEIDDIPKNDILKSRRLSIIPNLICNFACSYCYSARGRSNAAMEWTTAQAALDWFVDENRVERGDISIFISGGGEPLATWPLTRQIIEYAHNRAAAHCLELRIAIITNGSLITPEIAQFLAGHHCTVGVSFEVLEDLQNQQRRHYERVCQGINQLHQAGVVVKVNSTITPLSVSRMPEMVYEIAGKYPFVAQYTMEPVTGADLFATANDLRQFYDSFYNNYIECRRLANEMGVPLRFTFDDAMRGTTVRHCPGKLCVVPSGDISVCHLVSSPKEERFGECVYGHVADGRVEIDTQRFECLYNVNVKYYDECRDCFAKWNCGGECMTRRRTYPKEYMQEVCRFNRRFLLHQMIEQVKATIAEEYNLTIEQYLDA